MFQLKCYFINRQKEVKIWRRVWQRIAIKATTYFMDVKIYNWNFCHGFDWLYIYIVDGQKMQEGGFVFRHLKPMMQQA